MSDDTLSEPDRLAIVAHRDRLIAEGWEVSEDGRIVINPETVSEILQRGEDFSTDEAWTAPSTTEVQSTVHRAEDENP